MNTLDLFRGQKHSFIDFAKKHAVLFTFVLCVFCASLSFMRQVSIDPGNLFFLLAFLWGLGLFIIFYLNTKIALKGYIWVIIYFAFCVYTLQWIVWLHQPQKRTILIFSTFIVIIAAAALYLLIAGKMNYQNIAIIVFMAGFLIRLTYVLATSMYERQHDFYGFGDDGHGGYMNYIYANNFKLPDTNPINTDQFYHPPLHYFISAIWWKLLAQFGIADNYAQESIQMLTLFYSSVCLILTYKVLRLFEVKGFPLLMGFSIMAFHPTFIIFSASMNNDILSVTFMLTALYLGLKWYKSGKITDIMLCGLSIGLGMLTKMSAYLICIPIAFIFIARLIKDFKTDKTACLNRYCVQFGVFLAVCAPLALFWSLRNLILFDVPITFVQKLDEQSWQYIGNYSFFERMLTIFPENINWHYSVYDQWTNRGAKLYNEFNPMVSLLKTAMFGEYINDYSNPSIMFFGDVLFWSGALIAVLSVFAIGYSVFVAFKTKKQILIRLSMLVLHLSMLLFYYYFCFAFPHHCTMNIRYVSPLIFSGAIFTGIALKDISGIKKYELKIVIKISAAILITIFSIFSVLTYLIISA